MVDRFSITPFGLEVVVVVVVSDDGEGVASKPAPAAALCHTRLSWWFPWWPLAHMPCKSRRRMRAIDMVTHDFQFCIFLILHTINGGTQFELVPAFIVPELWLPTCVLRTDQ